MGLALGYITNAIGVDEKAEAEAFKLRDAWESHPDHTILKALVAERAIFFVILPFFRFCGDPGLRTVSADISRDEQIHVACNSLVCSAMGLRPSNSLDKNFWLDSSDRLMYEGKAPQLSDTRSARMP